MKSFKYHLKMTMAFLFTIIPLITFCMYMLDRHPEAFKVIAWGFIAGFCLVAGSVILTSIEIKNNEGPK